MNPMDDRLTGRVQRTLALARQEARDLRLPATGVETLVLAVAQDQDGPAIAALCGERDPAATAARLRALLGPSELPDLGPDAAAAMAEAGRLADASECGYVGMEHLLLALVGAGTGRADAVQQLLSRSVHADRDAVRDRLLAALERRGDPHDLRLVELMRAEAAEADTGD